MSFIDDVDSLKTKLHVRDMPAPLRIGLIVLGAIILFILFQGLWQLGAGDTHLIEASAQSSWQEEGDGLTIEDGQSMGEDAGSDGAASEAPASVSIHIVGEVNSPGLYEVAEGSRVKEVVEAAGGLSDDALESSINLARVVSDGEQIVVASKSDPSSSQAGTSTASASSGVSTASSLVNINTADVAALTTLSGIGESTAQKIIADREKNGPFKTKKDITRVSGIGDKKYEAIKDSITV